MFKQINAAKEVSKAMSATKVDVNPVLPFRQAANFSSFEINLFTNPVSMGCLFCLSWKQIHMENFPVSYEYCFQSELVWKLGKPSSHLKL